MTLKEALRLTEAESIATMALEVQGNCEDAIHLVEDILPATDAKSVVAILLEWREIERYDAEIHMEHDSEI